LDKFPAKAKTVVPKTIMAFGGVKKQYQRDDLIASLKDAANRNNLVIFG
jgi:cytochrome c2